MKRILFVDDEPNVLSGLRRLLRSKRTQWDMVFAGSGAEALAIMEESAFDVLVTDMQMPGMNGAALLQQVHDKYPSTVRLILSGQTDLEVAMRSVFVSHQFLTKPCEADALTTVVDRACRLVQIMNESHLKAVLGQLSELPVLPSAYKSLSTELARENVDIRAVASIVEQDVGIASKVLQLANSSFFGISRPVSSLHEATTFLGLTTLRDLVFSFGLFESLEAGAGAYRDLLEQEQRSSMAAGRIARQLLENKVASEQACLAAMMHRMGKLVLATYLSDKFARIMEAGAGVDRPFASVAEEVLGGVSHAQIGAYLLGLWGLPYQIVEAVALHLRPCEDATPRAFGVLGATHVAACLVEEQEGTPCELISLDEQYLQEVGVAHRLPEWRDLAAQELTLSA